MQHENLKCQNERFRCDPRTSVRGNFFLFCSYHEKWECSFLVLKLTFKMDLKESNLFIWKSILQNCSASQYVYGTA